MQALWKLSQCSHLRDYVCGQPEEQAEHSQEGVPDSQWHIYEVFL